MRQIQVYKSPIKLSPSKSSPSKVQVTYRSFNPTVHHSSEVSVRVVTTMVIALLIHSAVGNLLRSLSVTAVWIIPPW